MKKLAVLILVATFVLGTVPTYAQATKGASATAMEKASDESVFHRVGDWFATRGKTPTEAKAIIAQRKAERAAKRAQKQAEKAKKDMDKKMKDTKASMKKTWGK